MSKKSADNQHNEYLGIRFAQGYNKSFTEFKKEFEDIHIFLKMQPQDKEAALKDAHKIATNGNISGTPATSAATK